MKFCITSMWNVRVQIFILTGLFCEKKQWRLKTYWIKKSFIASIGWLESLKRTHGGRAKRLCGEDNDVSTMTIEASIERLPEFCQWYETQNILNLGELGLLFKVLPEKRLVEKKKQIKGGKKLKQWMTVMSIVATDGSFLFEFAAIWRSELPRCFRSVKYRLRPTLFAHYFSNSKA